MEPLAVETEGRSTDLSRALINAALLNRFRRSGAIIARECFKLWLDHAE